MRQLLEAGKGKETHAPSQPPERNRTLLTPWFQPSETAVGLLTYNCKICALSATKFVVIEQQKLTHLTNTGIQTNFIFMPFSLKKRERYTGFKIVYAMPVDFFFLMPTNFWGFLVCFCIFPSASTSPPPTHSEVLENKLLSVLSVHHYSQSIEQSECSVQMCVSKEEEERSLFCYLCQISNPSLRLLFKIFRAMKILCMIPYDECLLLYSCPNPQNVEHQE